MAGEIPQKNSTLNKVMLTTLVSVLAVFFMMIILAANILLNHSKNSARENETGHSDHIANSVMNSLYFMSSLMNMTRQSLSELDPRSGTAESSAENILYTLMELTPDVYCGWFIFEKGFYDDDRFYAKEFIKKDGAITENLNFSYGQMQEVLHKNQWYSEPLRTGEIFFDEGDFHDYGHGDEKIFAATISIPIEKDGRIAGVCGVDMIYDDIFEEMHDLYTKQDRTVLLLGLDMTILYSFDSGLVSLNLADFFPESTGAVQSAIKGETGYSAEIVSPFFSRKAQVTLRPILFNTITGYPPLFLYIETSLDILYRDAYNITFLIITASVFSLLIISGIIFINIKSVFGPISSLTSYAQKIAAGDFLAFPDDDGSLLLQSGNTVQEQSEIETLQSSFIKMVHTLRDNLNTVERRVEERTRELWKLNNYIKLLIENKTDMFTLLDREMKVVYCSRSVLDNLGAESQEEITGRSLDYVHGKFHDREFTRRSVQRFAQIKDGEDWLIEDDVINWEKKGPRSYRITYRRILDEGGNFDGVVLALHDLTDVRLEEAERRMWDIMYSTSLPCFVWDEKGNVVAYNNEISRILRIPKDIPPENMNKFLLDVIEPEYQPDGKPTMALKLEFIHEALNRGFYRKTVQLKKSNGAPIFFDISASRISWMSGYRLVLYLHDLTDIMAREAEAKEAEERVKLMLDATPLCCNLWDKDLNNIDCNEEAVKLFELPGKRAYLDNYNKLSPQYQPDGQLSAVKSANCIREAFVKGRLVFEWLHRKLDGELVPSEITLVRVKRENDFIVAGYTRDLREVKANEKKMLESIEQSRKLELQKEAAQAASEAKSQFLANMSHEIRTPMNAVLGISELLLSEELNQRQLHYVEDIKVAAKALLDIINDILDFSKIQSGKLSLSPQHYDFYAMIDNICSMVHFLVQNRDLSFKTELRGKIPRYLYGDDMKVRQVLLNLLGNAVKFTKEGFINFTVEAGEETILFTIDDTGIGIAEENIPNLFDAFEQFDTHINRNIIGTGLGLSIAKALIEMMDGQISVKSEYGKGTTFYVEIPLVPGDEKLISPAGSDFHSILAPEAKVLVVDDNKINLNVVCALLQLCQINTDTAESGHEAIRQICNNQYDIVFMDHMMPEMDGVEATKIIRQMGIQVPIIALTANAIAGAKEMFLAEGMNDFLSKPIIKEALLKILRNWIPQDKLFLVSNEKVNANRNFNRIENENDLDFWKEIELINGLSVKTGLERVSNKKDNYIRSLKLFINETEKNLNNLNECFSGADMQSFTAEIHSIKSSLANIGAMELSEKAQDLETASDRHDMDFCTINFPLFKDKLCSLNEKLKEVFSPEKQKSDNQEIPSEIPEILERMLNAFNVTDILAINREIKNLDALELSGALKENIEQIKDAVLIMDYSKAAEVIGLVQQSGKKDAF